MGPRVCRGALQPQVLGPARPYLLAFALAAQGYMWHAALANRQQGLLVSAAASSALTAGLALMPEMLHAWVHRSDGALLGSLSSARGVAGTDGSARAVELSLLVGGMGCTACTAKVKSAIEAVEGVARCEVDLAGHARLLASGGAAASPEELDRLQREVLLAVRGAGFSAEPDGRPVS